MENRQKPACVWTKKWPKHCKGAELAQFRVIFPYVKRGQLPSSWHSAVVIIAPVYSLGKGYAVVNIHPLQQKNTEPEFTGSSSLQRVVKIKLLSIVVNCVLYCCTCDKSIILQALELPSRKTTTAI